MNPTRGIAIVLLAAPAALAGCAGGAAGPAYSLGEIAGTWRLEVLDDRDVVVHDVRMRIDANRDRIGGFDGCGSLDGDVAIVQSRLQARRLNPTVPCDGPQQDVRDVFRTVLSAGARLLPVTREGAPWLALEGAGHALLFSAR